MTWTAARRTSASFSVLIRVVRHMLIYWIKHTEDKNKKHFFVNAVQNAVDWRAVLYADTLMKSFWVKDYKHSYNHK